MIRIGCWAVWLLSAGVLLAQEPAPEKTAPPTPVKTIAPPVRPLPGKRSVVAPVKPAPVETKVVPKAEVPGAADLEKLRENVAKLKAQRETMEATLKNTAPVADAGAPPDADRALLRLRMAELLTRASQKVETGKGRELPPLPAPGSLSGDLGRVAPASATDAMALAQSLFQASDYTGALQAYQGIPLDTLRLEDRAAIQYMVATCYRKLNKLDEAATRYRELVAAKTDNFIVECAQWQLEGLDWRKDLESQLDKVRQRRAQLEGKR